MTSWNRSWLLALSLAITLACFGCGGNGTSENGEDDTDGNGENTASGDPSHSDGPAEPPPKQEIAKIEMTAGQRAKCLVKQDDVMPEAQVQDFEGQSHSLQGMYGEKLTVIHFWTDGEDPFVTEDMLELLQRRVLDPFQEKGLRMVGINEGNTVEAIGQRMTAAGATFPMFLDPGRVCFKKVATEGLPRTYLLDSQGTILWFDVEFSQASLDELIHSIQVALGEI